AVTGSVGEGHGCTLTGKALGDDECDKGLECTGRGLADGMGACRHLCKADADCPSGQGCSLLFSPTFGVCVPRCTPFANDCGAGLTCGRPVLAAGSTQNDQKLFFLCRSIGDTPVGGDCMSPTGSDCVADSACYHQTCVPLCDDQHLCAAPPNGADG